MDVGIDEMKGVGRNPTTLGADLDGDVSANAGPLRSGGRGNDAATAIGAPGAKFVYRDPDQINDDGPRRNIAPIITGNGDQITRP